MALATLTVESNVIFIVFRMNTISRLITVPLLKLCNTLLFTRTLLRYVRVFAIANPSVVCRLSSVCRL